MIDKLDKKLYDILTECYSGIAKITLQEDDFITLKLKEEYIKNNVRESVESNIDKLCLMFTVNDVSKKRQLDIPGEKYFSKEIIKKSGDVAITNYVAMDPNYKLIVFNAPSKLETNLDNYRYIKIRLPDNGGFFSDLDDILIHTKGYSKNENGELDTSSKKGLGESQLQKYLAFTMGAVMIFMYPNYVPKTVFNDKVEDY